MKKIILFVVIMSAMVFLTAEADNPKSGEQINWQVLSNGGTMSTSSNYILQGTIGQTAVGASESTNYKLQHGFWHTFASQSGPCSGRCADSNGDGSVNVSDAVYIILYVFNAGSPPPLPVLACGDANTDAAVNVSDAVYIINFVFVLESPAPGDCSPGSWSGADCCPF